MTVETQNYCSKGNSKHFGGQNKTLQVWENMRKLWDPAYVSTASQGKGPGNDVAAFSFSHNFRLVSIWNTENSSCFVNVMTACLHLYISWKLLTSVLLHSKIFLSLLRWKKVLTFFLTCRDTEWKFGKNKKCHGNMTCWHLLSQLLWVLPHFHDLGYYTIITAAICAIVLCLLLELAVGTHFHAGYFRNLPWYKSMSIGGVK